MQHRFKPGISGVNGPPPHRLPACLPLGAVHSAVDLISEIRRDDELSARRTLLHERRTRARGPKMVVAVVEGSEIECQTLRGFSPIAGFEGSEVLGTKIRIAQRARDE